MAVRARGDGYDQQAISNLHEAARLAITAVATHDGYRFRDMPGAHKAVIDYGSARGVITDRERVVLQELSDMRNSAMYPSDLIEPSGSEMDVFEESVRSVMLRCRQVIEPKIPPPPT